MNNDTRSRGRYGLWMAFACLAATFLYWWPTFITMNMDKLDFRKNFQKEDQVFQRFFEALRQGELEKATALLGPQTRKNALKGLASLSQSFQTVGEVESIHLVHLKVIKTVGWVDRKMFIYFVDFKKGFCSIDFVLHPEAEGFLVDRFWANPSPVPYRDLARFDLRGRSWPQWAFLLMGYGLCLWMGTTLVMCATSDLRRKWLWILFILASVGHLNLIWAVPNGSLAGFFSGNFVYINLFPAGLLKVPLTDPWHLWLGFPLGALLFHLKRAGVFESVTARKL